MTLASVLNVLSSFMHRRDGVIALLDDDDTPEVVVGAGWHENTRKGHRTGPWIECPAGIKAELSRLIWPLCQMIDL
jgi:hypothetical protein